MHRVTLILQHVWQYVADPWGFVVLEAFEGDNNSSQHDFWEGLVWWEMGGKEGKGAST